MTGPHNPPPSDPYAGYTDKQKDALRALKAAFPIGYMLSFSDGSGVTENVDHIRVAALYGNACKQAGNFLHMQVQAMAQRSAKAEFSKLERDAIADVMKGRAK